MRRTLVVSAAVTLLVLAACAEEEPGAGGETDAGDEPTATEEPDAADPQPTGEETDGETTAGLDELIAAAQEEGSLVWYSGDSEDVNTLQADLFEEKYGIEVEWLRAPMGELMQRIESEIEAGIQTADVLTLATLELFEASPDTFVTLSEDVVPGWDEYVEVGRGDNYVLVRDNPDTLMYNTDLVSEDMVPQEWPDVIDPAFEDQVILVDPRVSPTLLATMRIIMEEHGIELLEQLREQGFEVATGGGAAAAQQLAAGTGAIAFPGRTVHGISLMADGAPIDYVVMPGAGATINTGAISAAQSPNAARLFVHFQMSAEAQELLCANDIVTASFVPTDSCLELPDDWQYPDYDTSPEDEAAILQALGL